MLESKCRLYSTTGSISTVNILYISRFTLECVISCFREIGLCISFCNHQVLRAIDQERNINPACLFLYWNRIVSINSERRIIIHSCPVCPCIIHVVSVEIVDKIIVVIERFRSLSRSSLSIRIRIEHINFSTCSTCR